LYQVVFNTDSSARFTC